MRVMSGVVLAGIVMLGSGARGQAPAGATMASFAKARATLAAAIDAHGGEEKLRALDDVTLTFSGKRWLAHQSVGARKPWDSLPADWRLVLDLKNARYRMDQVTRYPKDFAFHSRRVVTAEGGFAVDPTRAGQRDLIFRFGREGVPGARVGYQRELPGLVLLRALERAPTLRSLGTADEGGRRYDVLTYAEAEGAQIALFVDATTHLLARYELLRDDPVIGDQVFAVAFGDYRPVSGIPFPHRRTELRNGEVLQDGALAVEVGTHPADSLFAAPQGYVDAPTDRGAEGEPVRRLAENVHLLQALPGGNKVMVVAFSDHVLVLEAPTPQSAATAVMAAVKATVPGKPVRYVAFTHNHDDHGGGLRPWIAEGVTIVTTPGNRGFIDEVARAPHTILPDALSRKPKAPVVEIFRKKRVFTDGTTTVELHDIGPTSHATELVMAYLPKEKLIFQGDLIIPPAAGELPPANTLTAEFLERIERLGLDVQTIAGVHGRVVTIDELRSAVARRGR